VSVWAPIAIAAALLLLLIAVAVLTRRGASAREARRVKALEALAERLETSIVELRPPSFPQIEPSAASPGDDAPLIADRLPGRAAFLDAVAAEIARAGPGARLAVALARAAGDTTPELLVDAVREVTGRQAYAVGPSSVAFALPALGRAGGLGALARIEALAASAGKAIERAPDEGAVALVARLLEQEAED
jgi:hypothetical protein